MSGHVMRGRFVPRCPDCKTVDYSTAWPLEVRIPLLIVITVFFMHLHPSINSFFKRCIWMIVKPFAMFVGFLNVAMVRFLIFIFIDGPAAVSVWMDNNEKCKLDVLGSLDVDNNTKLNAIMGRLQATEADAWVPGGVFDKKYKPYLVAGKMNFAGPRQKIAMTRKRNNSC